MENIYIFGHKNPDTDSICSSICYAYLKNKIDSDNHYIPIRLGELNNETDYVLNYFKQKAPDYVSKMKTQVSDIILPKNTYVKESDTIRCVFEVISSNIGRTFAVADNNEKFIGVVSITDVLPLYLNPYDPLLFNQTQTTFKHLIETCELTVVNPIVNEEKIINKIYFYSDIKDFSIITKEDIIIFTASDYSSTLIKDSNIHHAIIVNYHEGYKNEYNDLDCTIMVTDKSIAEILKLLNLAIPISTVVKKNDLVYFTTYETIDDVKENMMSSKHRRFPVVNELGQIMGTISRSNLIDINRKKAILVDHNESGQSIDGIEDINIVEVIDHHRVADINTLSPLYFRVEPVGCTCTIIAKLFEENNESIPEPIAGLLLSAILSDTLIFNSPTCTDTDRKTAEKLAKIANIDINRYGRRMIDRGASLDGETYESLITKDMKRFMFGKYKLTISQINTSDFDQFYLQFSNIYEELTNHCHKENVNLSILMVTDLVLGGTELIATGDAKFIANEAFNMTDTDKSIFLFNVFSRKKQVVPRLMQAAHL